MTAANKDRDLKIIKLLAKGGTNLGIAKQVGCSTGVVAGVRRRSRQGKPPAVQLGAIRKEVRPLVTFGSLSQCAYPIGDPKKADFRFCGAPVATVGKPYCAKHQAATHIKAGNVPEVRE